MKEKSTIQLIYKLTELLILAVSLLLELKKKANKKQQEKIDELASEASSFKNSLRV